jgi:hypothetical protein
LELSNFMLGSSKKGQGATAKCKKKNIRPLTFDVESWRPNAFFLHLASHEAFKSMKFRSSMRGKTQMFLLGLQFLTPKVGG